MATENLRAGVRNQGTWRIRNSNYNSNRPLCRRRKIRLCQAIPQWARHHTLWVASQAAVRLDRGYTVEDADRLRVGSLTVVPFELDLLSDGAKEKPSHPRYQIRITPTLYCSI